MTQSSNIWIETDDTPEGVRRVLERTTPFRAAPDFEGMKEMIAENTTLSISPRRPDDYRPAAAGLSCNLQLFFGNMDKRSGIWITNMVSAAMALLHAYPGDLLFMYLLHYPALMRRQGRLVLQYPGLWDPQYRPDVISLIDLPYGWGDLPNP